jgi:hypothetical protein
LGHTAIPKEPSPRSFDGDVASPITTMQQVMTALGTEDGCFTVGLAAS